MPTGRTAAASSGPPAATEQKLTVTSSNRHAESKAGICPPGDAAEARAFCRRFFHWYNDEHRHSGTGLLTPAMVHHGMADQIATRRAEVLADAYDRHPERFKRGQPRPRTATQSVWINRPDDTP